MDKKTGLERLKQQLISLPVKEQIVVSQTLLNELYAKSETFEWT